MKIKPSNLYERDLKKLKTDISKQKTYIAILPHKIVIIISVGISDNLHINVLWRYM